MFAGLKNRSSGRSNERSECYFVCCSNLPALIKARHINLPRRSQAKAGSLPTAILPPRISFCPKLCVAPRVAGASVAKIRFHSGDSRNSRKTSQNPQTCASLCQALGKGESKSPFPRQAGSSPCQAVSSHVKLCQAVWQKKKDCLFFRQVAFALPECSPVPINPNQLSLGKKQTKNRPIPAKK
jgi:hypothetical protein